MTATKQQADMLVDNAAQVVTCHIPDAPAPRSGAAMKRIACIERGAVAVRAGTIVAVGPRAEVMSRVELAPGATRIDAGGGVVTPGFIDCHTHLVFDRWRSNEFVRRMEGASYLEILEGGGGILSSVRTTREASKEELVKGGLKRLDTALSLGTTTVEVKSGYGLDRDTELKMLDVAAELNRLHPVDVVPTFMGAHAVPPEFTGRPADYLKWLEGEVLPEVASRQLAEFCDIFCENRVFPADISGPYLERARELGFEIRLHADEMEPSGACELAASLSARSADHCLKVSPGGIEALAAAGVTAVLLPGTGLYLGETAAPARRLLAAGVPVALSTDFNPGSSPTLSLPLIMNLGCVLLGMTPAETLNAVTVNAASVLGRHQRTGSLAEGKAADMVVLDIPGWEHLAYRFGDRFVKSVVKDGTIVFIDGSSVKRNE